MNRHDVALGDHYRVAMKMVVIGSKFSVADTAHLVADCIGKSFQPYWSALEVGNAA